MRSILLLIAGIVAVFSAHVGLPYIYVSASRTGALPNRLSSLTDGFDPAIWMILFPFALAWFGYNYVFRHSGVAGLVSRRLGRWPIALAATFLSLWAELSLMFNTFGS